MEHLKKNDKIKISESNRKLSNFWQFIKELKIKNSKKKFGKIK